MSYKNPVSVHSLLKYDEYFNNTIFINCQLLIFVVICRNIYEINNNIYFQIIFMLYSILNGAIPHSAQICILYL